MELPSAWVGPRMKIWLLGPSDSVADCNDIRTGKLNVPFQTWIRTRNCEVPGGGLRQRAWPTSDPEAACQMVDPWANTATG